MESFYGGKQGFNFTLVKSFPSVEIMKEAFKRGAFYTDVNYGEYVIINTINKLDKDNGSIYRRGYNYSDEYGGAEYIGTVVGPAGPAPNVEIDKYDKIMEMENSTHTSISWHEGDLYPGSPTAQNDIYMAAVNIRNENGDDTVLKLGFKIPFPNFVFKGKIVGRNEYDEKNLISRVQPYHPFYEQWQLNIPEPQQADNYIVVGRKDEVSLSLNNLDTGGIWFEVE